MPPWLDALLTPVAVLAALFLLAWMLRREAIPPRGRVVGWASVAVTGFALAASFWLESLQPYLRAGRTVAAARSLAQVTLMLLGVALALRGAVRFLRAWRDLVWLFERNPAAARFREPRPQAPPASKYAEAQHWAQALELGLHILRLPGLDAVLLGLGLTILAGQWLEPDPSLSPDLNVVSWGLVFVVLGALQALWRRQGGLT